MTTNAEASALNRELTDLLVAAGERRGFAPVVEYPIPGGRLDVVWTLPLSAPVPGFERPIPVVGFEVESSWRTRKHVKGDLLNLADAGVAVGVIVLAGDDPRDESLRRFAAGLVARPGPQVLIWTTEDVRALASGDASPDLTSIDAAEPHSEPIDLAAPVPSPLRVTRSHTGKYAPLWRWLIAQDAPTMDVSFADIEDVLGFPLPDSCRHHLPHWYGYDGSAVARAIIDAGWKASNVNLTEQTVILRRA